MTRKIIYILFTLSLIAICGVQCTYASVANSLPLSEKSETSITVRDLDEILASLNTTECDSNYYSLVQVPYVFRGFMNLRTPVFSPAAINICDVKFVSDSIGYTYNNAQSNSIEKSVDVDRFLKKIDLKNIDRDMVYRAMLRNPESISYSLWTLPEPVRLIENDYTRASFIKGQNIPKPQEDAVEIPPVEIDMKHWLHVFDGSIQFSQAYLSPNWYQGGNNNLALLIGFLWNVKLNEVYHPRLMFENNIQYKLGLFSTPQDKYHKYSISEDLFQWNLKAGVKAFHKWFYSVNLQFKTQLFNNYIQDDIHRAASLLSPGDFNIGIGMTYSTENTAKTFKLNATISPISYNLRTCIDSDIDSEQFNIPIGHKTFSEIGSTGEIVLEWNIISNIKYLSRLFLFSNYKNFMGDWENTMSFSINRFLSTQIYVHLRYDTSTEPGIGKWNHWMLKEILSFGFQYKFSTKK